MATKDTDLVLALKGDITIRKPVGGGELPTGALATVEAVEQAITTELSRSGAVVHVRLTKTGPKE